MGRCPPNHHLFVPLRVSVVWLRPHAFYLGLSGGRQNTTSHCTPLSEVKRWQGPRSLGSMARFPSKYWNKLGSSHLKSSWSHRHLISELPSAAGMCTFDSPRSLKGCKGTAENDHRLRAQWIEQGLCSFVDLKRHCQDLKVKNWTRHALFLSDGEKSDKKHSEFWENNYFPFFFFFKIYFFGTHKTFVLCSPGHRKHPAEDYIGACPPTDIMELFHKFKLWLLIQCRQDHIKHLCSSKKRQRKKRKERAVCQGEADKFVKGENSLSSLWVGVTNKSESLEWEKVLHLASKHKKAKRLTTWQCPFKNDGQSN